MRGLLLSLGALVAVLVVGAGVLGAPGLLAAPGGEVYGHAWVQWWHGAALPGWPSGPEGLLLSPREWPVIDPLPTAFAGAVGRLFGAVVGYNAWILVSIALAFLGGAALARRLGGDPFTGGAVLALSPIFVGSLASGLTEDGAIGLLALALAYVGDRDPRKGVLGGVFLGLLGWCGLVLAWYGALAAIIVGIAALIRDRRSLGGLVGGAGIAGLLVAPVALVQGERMSGQGHAFGVQAEAFEPLWRVNPWGGADLASFFVPGRVHVGDALVRLHPAYLGLGVLLLVAMGIARRWGPDRPPTGRWVAVLFAALVIAPGMHLRLLGDPLGLLNPFAEAAAWLPFGDLLNHHGRAMLMGAVALAALASLGAARLGPWAPLGALVVLLDFVAFSPVGVRIPITPASPPGVVACRASPCVDDLSPGALLDIPAAGPGVAFQRPLLDQRFHGRALRLNPNRPGLDARTDSERWLGSLAFPGHGGPPEVFEPPRGVSVLLVRDPYVDEVTAVLGPPHALARDSAAWDMVVWTAPADEARPAP